ncbi:MAG: SPFH domain-containing protein [archaeon]
MAKRVGDIESYKVKQAIFALIVVIIIAVAYLVYLNKETIAFYLGIGFIVLLILFLIKQYDFLLTLKEYERAVVFTFGRVSRVGGPGWTWIVPLVQSYRLVDLRTETIDVEPQEVVTVDKIELTVDAVIYLFVNKDRQSVINSVVQILDYKRASKLFVQASLRDVIGSMTMSEVIANIEKVNQAVKNKLIQITSSWGINVESVEIKNVVIPREVLDAMHFQKAEEQRKLAKFEEAQGKRYEIDAIRDAADKLTDKSITYYYLKALENIADGKSTKIIFPLEVSRLAESVTGSISGKTKSEPLDLEKLSPYIGAFKKFMKETQKKKLKK